MAPDQEAAPPQRGRAAFATTRWSVVVAAGERETPESRDALAVLCETYWYPLYAYLRRRGYSTQEAEDLVQAFFVRLLDKHVVEQADPERGRFRSFLLGALKHFAANEFDRTRALKRGGGRPVLNLDALNAEGRYALEPREDVTPEALFERRWAQTLLDRAITQLRQDMTRAGRAGLFEALTPYLIGEDIDVPYRDLGASLKQTEGALRVTVHRLRKALRREIEREIGQTVSDPEQIEDELRFLHATVALTR